jgi:hypothetical protein
MFVRFFFENETQSKILRSALLRLEKDHKIFFDREWGLTWDGGRSKRATLYDGGLAGSLCGGSGIIRETRGCVLAGLGEG